MNKRSVFVSSIVLIGVSCVFHVLTWQHLEITESNLFSIYRTTSFVLFGFLLILQIVSAPSDYSSLFSRMLVIMIALCAGLLWVFLTIFYPFPYARKDTKVLYINKQNTGKRIVEQTTFAGAIGSDRHDTILIKQLTDNVRWRNEIDLTRIDEKEWMPSDK